MKKLLLSSCLVFALTSTLQAQVVIDLRTGVIDGTNTHISVPGIDDTWKVCPPGSSHTNPASYQPAHCITTTSPPGNYGTFDPAAGLIAPDPSGGAIGGYYYYKMRFYYPGCAATSATFDFATIGGDDAVDMVMINNYTHTPLPVYGYNPFATNISFTVPPANIWTGWNDVIIRVYNWGGTLVTATGMHVNGKLTITGSILDPAFSLTTGSGSPKLSATATGTGSHTWKIYTAPSSSGPFTYVNYSTASSFTSNAPGPCYYVVHTISNDCGEACEAKIICHSDCDQTECTLTKPDHLTYDAASQHMSWDPVPNAAYYDVQITLNDPACCGWPGNPGDPMEAPTVRTIRVYDITYDLQPSDLVDNHDMYTNCFSWKVIAYCPDGTKSVSGTYCSNGTGGTGDPNDPPAGMMMQPQGNTGSIKSGQSTNVQQEQNGTQVNIFPNRTNSDFFLEIKTSVAGTSAEVNITDINGKVVKTFDKLTGTDKTLRLKWNAGTLGKGVYMVNVLTSDQHQTTQKLLVE